MLVEAVEEQVVEDVDRVHPGRDVGVGIRSAPRGLKFSLPMMRAEDDLPFDCGDAGSKKAGQVPSYPAHSAANRLQDTETSERPARLSVNRVLRRGDHYRLGCYCHRRLGGDIADVIPQAFVYETRE